MRGAFNRVGLVDRLLAALAASAIVGAGCGGSSVQSDEPGAAGGGDDDTSGAPGFGGSQPGSTGGLPGVAGRGGTSGTNAGGTGAIGGDAGDAGEGGSDRGGIGGGIAGGGIGGGGAPGIAGGGFAGVGPLAGAGAGVGGSGGVTTCLCPMECFAPDAVPLIMGGKGGTGGAPGGAGAGGASAGSPGASGAAGGFSAADCPAANLVNGNAMCSGSPFHKTATGPYIGVMTCCYVPTYQCPTAGTGGEAGVGGGPTAGVGGGPTAGVGPFAGAGGGRPFVVGRDLRVAEIVERSDWSAQAPETSDLSEEDRKALARAWLDDALVEHASVAAFARFTLELLALGAPPELLRAAQAAALDEIEHARLCFAVASRHARRPLGPGKLDVQGAVETTDFVAFALRTFEEGCVGETLGALEAAERLAQASDPFVRAVLERIVEDEERHAELAWRAVQWAIRTGGVSVARAIERAFHELAEAAPPRGDVPASESGPAWRAHGRLSPSEAFASRRKGLSEVVAPCVRALLGSAAARTDARSEAVVPLTS